MSLRTVHKRAHRSVIGTVRRSFLIVLLLILLIGGAGGFELYREGHTVKSQSADILISMKTLSSQIALGDFEGVTTTASKIQEQTDQVRTTVESPLWDFACGLPMFGEDVQNVRTLAEALSDISKKGISPISKHAQTTDIVGLKKAYTTLDLEIQKAKTSIDSLHEGSNDEVNNAIARAKEYLERVPSFSNTGALS